MGVCCFTGPSSSRSFDPDPLRQSAGDLDRFPGAPHRRRVSQPARAGRCSDRSTGDVYGLLGAVDRLIRQALCLLCTFFGMENRAMNFRE